MVPSDLTELYARLADKDINILGAVTLRLVENRRIAVHVEYMYRRPRDGKVIWPHFIVEDASIEDAVRRAEKIVDGIRGN